MVRFKLSVAHSTVEQDPVRTFALIIDFREIRSVFPIGSLDRGIDVGLRHILCLGIDDRGTELVIAFRISASLFCRQGNGP